MSSCIFMVHRVKHAKQPVETEADVYEKQLSHDSAVCSTQVPLGPDFTCSMVSLHRLPNSMAGRTASPEGARYRGKKTV